MNRRGFSTESFLIGMMGIILVHHSRHRRHHHHQGDVCPRISTFHAHRSNDFDFSMVVRRLLLLLPLLLLMSIHEGIQPVLFSSTGSAVVGRVVRGGGVVDAAFTGRTTRRSFPVSTRPSFFFVPSSTTTTTTTISTPTSSSTTTSPQSSSFRLLMTNPTTTPTSRTNKEDEEPLSVIFQRAVVIQRSGSGHSKEALKEYEFFLKATKQCSEIIEPYMYAEVYGNMGVIYLRLKEYEQAYIHFHHALSHRPKFGTVHVNLAVLELQQLPTTSTTTSSSIPSPLPDGTTTMKTPFQRIETAKDHCHKALECNTDPRSVAMAKKLLLDIDQISQSLQFQ